MAPLPPIRDNRLDVLRGLAALAVTLFHLNEPVPPADHWYRAGVRYGWLGVVCFFVLSGYVVHQAATRPMAAPGRYAWRRLTRIYPPYWGSLLVIAAVCVGRKLTVGVNDRAAWPHAPGEWLAT